MSAPDTATWDAVDAWLVGVLGIPATSVFRDFSAVQQAAPPAVLTMPLGEPGRSDVLDADVLQEHFRVVLVGPYEGAGIEERAAEIEPMATRLVRAAQTSRRASAAWEHLTLEFVGSEPAAGVSTWRLCVWTRV